MMLDHTNMYPTAAAPHLNADIRAVLLSQLQATRMIDTSHVRIVLISTVVLVVSVGLLSTICTYFYVVLVPLEYCI